ncbi:MAG: hypothetical protein ABIJ43_05375 [Candidatus Beckwithbacteria bacterium]|nr:hypothetical protein [Patescibacteria group bacterium]
MAEKTKGLIYHKPEPMGIMELADRFVDKTDPRTGQDTSFLGIFRTILSDYTWAFRTMADQGITKIISRKVDIETLEPREDRGGYRTWEEWRTEDLKGYSLSMKGERRKRFVPIIEGKPNWRAVRNLAPFVMAGVLLATGCISAGETIANPNNDGSDPDANGNMCGVLLNQMSEAGGGSFGDSVDMMVVDANLMNEITKDDVITPEEIQEIQGQLGCFASVRVDNIIIPDKQNGIESIIKIRYDGHDLLGLVSDEINDGVNSFSKVEVVYAGGISMDQGNLATELRRVHIDGNTGDVIIVDGKDINLQAEWNNDQIKLVFTDTDGKQIILGHDQAVDIFGAEIVAGLGLTASPTPEVTAVVDNGIQGKPYPVSTEGFGLASGGNEIQIRDAIYELSGGDAQHIELLIKWRLWRQYNDAHFDNPLEATQEAVDKFFDDNYKFEREILAGESWTVVAQDKKTGEFWSAANEGSFYHSFIPLYAETIDDFILSKVEIPNWADEMKIIAVTEGKSLGHFVAGFYKDGEFVGWFDIENNIPIQEQIMAELPAGVVNLLAELGTAFEGEDYEMRGSEVYYTAEGADKLIFNVENKDGVEMAVFAGEGNVEYPLSWVGFQEMEGTTVLNPEVLTDAGAILQKVEMSVNSENRLVVIRPSEDVDQFWNEFESQMSVGNQWEKETLRRLQGENGVMDVGVMQTEMNKWLSNGWVEAMVVDGELMEVPTPRLGMPENQDDLLEIDTRILAVFMEKLLVFEKTEMLTNPIKFNDELISNIRTADDIVNSQFRTRDFVTNNSSLIGGVFKVSDGRFSDDILVFGLSSKLQSATPEFTWTTLHFGIDMEAMAEYLSKNNLPLSRYGWVALQRLESGDFRRVFVRTIFDNKEGIDNNGSEELMWLLSKLNTSKEGDDDWSQVFETMRGDKVPVTKEFIDFLERNIIPAVFTTVYENNE